jgi:hypothetical protein
MKRCTSVRMLWLALAAAPNLASATACLLTPTADASGAIARHGGETLKAGKVIENCANLTLEAGTAMAQYIDKAGRLGMVLIKAGAALAVPDLNANAQPVKVVGRGLLSILTDAPERAMLGKKYFDKPAQVGAPFGDVYVPPEGLAVRFADLEGEARIQIFEGQRVVFETIAAQGLTLDRTRFRPAVTYGIRIVTTRGKLPDGAFEIVASDLQSQLDDALGRIERDERLDAHMRAVGKALLLEHEGLSFNREVLLRGMKK